MDEKFAFLDSWNGLSEQDRAYYMRSMSGNEPYQLKGDSLPQKGVPAGKITKYHMPDCSKYPGVARDYWIYVPATYRSNQTACLIIYLDGYNYISNCNAQYVMDNLIYKKEMPVSIALFIGPGDKGPGYPIYGGEDNRSVEYDSIDGTFADFLIQDMIPVLKEKYNITDDPDGRMIVGMSSGGNAAFAAAWNRPDAFRKVISHSGSFTNLRGGNLFPTLIRTSEKKPIKVFLCTGEKDLDTTFGSWRISNEYMASSLQYKGYSYDFQEGVGGHTYMYGGMLLPDTMRWMWKDYIKGKKHPDSHTG